MPATPRATRRAARAGPPRDAASLRAALVAARAPGSPAEVTERARAGLLAWLDASTAQPFETLVRALATGAVATQIGRAMLAQTPEPPGLACAAGCAFCCILPGADGATITGAEARALHAALAPQSGPGGTDWHPEACPALDPDTRMCRAYDARPMICRSYVSRDAAACAAIAEGRPMPGPATHPAQITYLTAHALARAALAGVAPTPTYALKTVAARAGASLAEALKTARHAPKSLDAERRRLVRGMGPAR
ncbi:YkgJ family cysteine cluster protein [Jannaschia ovalis]|uniref:YkgJ family cysteine cluster protein n=1 Tax=Jannaschia ovalis TaxID=3038773 RepID=A0ABY8LE73_9RHOB|nr:YkgJ family cysteine cluster protein [Jannaschia sp. GRR-S6-38]WGH79456.1 YkgJ family cysteine cluster protein [Jannaschia sp. GRR-S6-38]